MKKLYVTRYDASVGALDHMTSFVYLRIYVNSPLSGVQLTSPAV